MRAGRGGAESVHDLSDGPTPRTSEVERSGEPLVIAADEDLVVRAFARGRVLCGAPPCAARFSVRSAIPVGRGLGSSGAAIAAGLILGVRSCGSDPRALWPAIVAAGVALEGHPDNVVAALHGGATLGVPLSDGTTAVLELDVHPSLAWAVAWPRAPLATSEARRALPRHVPFEDAVENPRRLALLLRGLASGEERWLAEGSHDRLHERYRLPLIPGAAEALAAARAAGAWVATISGAGSGLVACGPADRCSRFGAALVNGLGPGARGGPVAFVPAGVPLP